MSYSAPFKQLNPIFQAVKVQSLQADRSASLNTSSVQLCREMSKSMDVTRFTYVYGIGHVMTHAKLTTLLDDFVFMTSAERHHPEGDHQAMVKFMCMGKLALELMESQAPISLNVANMIHESCDIARARLPHYSTETMGKASLAMQDVWNKRAAALETRADRRRVLRIQK